VKIKKSLFVGIDLGTSYTKVYVEHQGIIAEFPTVIALNRRSRSVVAFGEEKQKR